MVSRAGHYVSEERHRRTNSPFGVWCGLLSFCTRATRQPVFYVICAFLIGSFAFLRSTVLVTQLDTIHPSTSKTAKLSVKGVPPMYAVASLAFSRLPNQIAVEKAVQFILRLQPEGTYILTSAHSDDVVHMDVAHSVIALTKVGHVREAKRAMNWLLGEMTDSNSPERFGTVNVDGKQQTVDYAGSWWDHLRPNGEPRRNLTRGRGEGVGIALIAIYTIFQEDPAYLHQLINGTPVIDRIALAVKYLTSPAVQRDDGGFNHRPDYRVSFNEEGARMVLGLRLASDMLRTAGDGDNANLAAERAEKGLAALRKGDNINQGMAFDYYALSIWGLASDEQAREEFGNLRRAQLLSLDGVRNWDWQLNTAQSFWNRLRWWAISQSIAPAQTFDWAIANVTVGNLDEARRIEQRWLPLQLPDGGFSGVYLPGLQIGLGDPTSYSAARFILLERLLAEAEAMQRSVVTH